MENKLDIALIREVLLELVRRNEDKTWLAAFEDLQVSGSLPGGGAGSLNDWGPYYKDAQQQIWYGILYELFRKLDRSNGAVSQIASDDLFSGFENLKVFECKMCKTRFFHPSAPERFLALAAYLTMLTDLPGATSIAEWLDETKTIHSPAIEARRKHLHEALDKIPAIKFDFVKAKAGCPKCTATIADTYHNLYVIHSDLTLEFVKQDGDFFDFKRRIF